MHVLGIDIGGSGIKGAPVDITTGSLAGERYRIKTPQPATPQKVANAVGRIAKHFEWDGPIGCTLPARVQHGVAHTATNIHKTWIQTAVDELFSSQTGLPVHVLNDADAAGVAAMAYGAGRDRDDLVLMLTVGTGIGSALFVNRELVPNTELGHLDLNGRNAELYCSDRARKRDRLSWKQWAKRFQTYLDTVEFLFAPDLIILGGGISRPSKVAKYMRYLSTRAELVPAVLENEAGIIGAAHAAGNLVGA